MIKYTCGAGTPEEAEANCTYFIRGECTASFCEYRRKKQTNADRIRAMNDEELAEFLIDLADDGNLKIREWLQQPAEGMTMPDLKLRDCPNCGAKMDGGEQYEA